MRKRVLVCLAAVALFLVGAAPGDARPRHGFQGGSSAHHRGFRGRHVAFRGHHSRVRTHIFFGFGPAWWGPSPWWYYPAPVYVNPPAVVVEQPSVYIQQEPAPAPAPQAYWYYCPNSRAYYPNVQSCPEPWVKVLPRAE